MYRIRRKSDGKFLSNSGKWSKNGRVYTHTQYALSSFGKIFKWMLTKDKEFVNNYELIEYNMEEKQSIEMRVARMRGKITKGVLLIWDTKLHEGS